MNNPRYKVTVRGPLPPGIREKLAQAQATAMQAKRATKKPAG